MKKSLIILFLFVSAISFGKEPTGNIYWVQFNTKTGTPFSVDQPEKYLSERSIERRIRQGITIDSTDLPVNPALIDSLRFLGFNIISTSRWINGALATLDSSLNLDSLSLPSFVSFCELRKGTPLKSISTKFEDIDSLSESYYGSSTDQITMLNGHLMHNYSKGEGIQIAVIDAGFLDADKYNAFDSLFLQNRVLGTFDFVNPGNNVYNEYYHGTAVLSTMAANLPGTMVGTAPESSYWLLRSEDVSTEYPVEEDYWIFAAEFADSVGCDVTNTSLGYTVFDDSIFDHNYGQFTGDSLRISKAANMAVDKGMVMICSAGNDGSSVWQHIATPAEAKNVLAVAAVSNTREIAGFSSRGFDGALVPKPDVSAMGSNSTIINSVGEVSQSSGTSFSGPILAGMAACLVKLYPEKKASEIIEMIRKAGNLYPEHSNDYGYGIPNFGLYVEDTTSTVLQIEKDQLIIFPNPFSSEIIVSDTKGFSTIDLRTAQGKKVYSAEISSSFFSTDLSSLPKGFYFATMKGNKKVKTIKLLKN
jgi:serine protease AprX